MVNSSYFKNIKETEIIEQIKNITDVDVLLSCICNYENNNLILDYRYFKYSATNTNYIYIINHIVKTINHILNTHNLFNVYVCMQYLSVLDIDKHSHFIYNISNTLKIKFPDKLNKCHVYNAPYIFTNIYNLISTFVDKKTQEKIKFL